MGDQGYPLRASVPSAARETIPEARFEVVEHPHGFVGNHLKPGDLIHFFQGGTITIPTVGSIDPAGNLWIANNWNSVEAATSPDPTRPTSTWGGVRLYRRLRSRGSGENPALGHGAQAVTSGKLGRTRPNRMLQHPRQTTRSLGGRHLNVAALMRPEISCQSPVQ
jgi:hypothetical protein